MKKIRIIVYISFLWLLAIPIRAADHYVRPAGTCTNTENEYPYTNWDTAATTIQWAVNAAAVDETVWVTNGEYCLTNQIAITNRITLKSMNGYSNTLVYAGWPTWTTRCFYVTRTGIVDGFTISNGHYYGNNDYSGGGGAWVATNGLVQNCYFVNNICSNAGAYTGGGGAYVAARGIVSNCLIFSNMCYDGGDGAYSGNGGGVMVGASAYVLSCQIISNYLSGYGGGGVYFFGSGVVSNCLIAYNRSAVRTGGGAELNNVDQGQLINCVVSNNSANEDGGGAALVNRGLMRDCVVVNNYAREGGGIWTRYASTPASIMVSNCVIANNACNKSGGLGGGIHIDDGGIYYSCRVSNNLALYGGGGGIAIYGKDSKVYNCVIQNNTNMTSSVGGGGVLMNISAQSASSGFNPSNGLVNCTIVNNFSTNDGGGIATQGTNNNIANCIIASNRCSSNNYPDVYNTGVNSNNYWYSCANVPNAPLAPGQGNITNDPKFVAAAPGGWRLQASSPCINAGTNQSWMTNAFDLDGRIRIRYGTVDMGAYETIYEGSIYRGF